MGMGSNMAGVRGASPSSFSPARSISASKKSRMTTQLQVGSTPPGADRQDVAFPPPVRAGQPMDFTKRAMSPDTDLAPQVAQHIERGHPGMRAGRTSEVEGCARQR